MNYMGNQLVTLEKCPACGFKHADLTTMKCTEGLWLQGYECVRYVVCPEKKTTVYLSHERGRLIGLLKSEPAKKEA